MRGRWAHRPRYAACNEDSRTELAALAPSRGDVVVCVAAGGGRALSLLGAGPARLLAVDRSESQLHALELKAAALDALPYGRLLSFLGVAPDAERVAIYASLRASLSPRARRHWDRRAAWVREGPLYAGRLERALARWAAWLRRAGIMRWPDEAFAATTLAEQRAVLLRRAYEVVRAGRWWRAFFHPPVAAVALRDPSFRRSTEGAVGAYLYGRMLAFAQQRLLRESALLHLIWFGRYDAMGALPLWLTAEGAERARLHLARMELRCAALERIAPHVPRDATLCWSLSDVSAWMRAARFHALLEAIAAASPPGSRLCWRHLAAHWPDRPIARLAYDAPLARRLEARDASVFYAIGCARAVDCDGAAAAPSLAS